jgi:hypothetical protein
MLDSAGGSPADALSTWVAALPLSAGQIRLEPGMLAVAVVKATPQLEPSLTGQLTTLLGIAGNG